MRQTRHIDALRENRIVEDDELFVIITTPFVESFEELLTTNLLTVDISTVLAGDVKNVVTHIVESVKNIGTGEHLPQHTGVRCSNKNFSGLFFIKIVDDVEHHLTIYISSVVLVTHKFSLMHNKLWRNDAAISNKFWSRNSLQSITEDNAIVHAIGIRIARELGSRSKEETVICTHGSSSNTDKVCFLSCIVCLITIHHINSDIAVNNAIETVVGSEDQLMNIDMLTNSIVTLNVSRFGRLEMHSLTTVNMHHHEIVAILIVWIAIEILHELGAKLISKKDARCNNNNSLRVFCIIKTTHTIFHHDDSLATTSRNIDTTFLRVLECIKSARLVGSESKRHVFLSMM